MKYCFLLLCLFFLASPNFAQNSRPPVRFDQGPVVFPDNIDQAQPAPDPAEIIDGRIVRFVQSSALLTAADRARLQDEGVQFIGYIDFGAYLLSWPAEFDAAKLRPYGVRSVVPVLADWKMARRLKEPPYPSWALHGDQIDLQIQVYPHLSISRGGELCRQMGLTVLEEGSQNGILQLRAPIAQLERLAEQPFVQYLDIAPAPPEPDDTRGRSLHRSNLLDRAGSDGLQLDGSGVTVLVRDDGLVGPHIDFQGRLQNLTTDNGADQHADGVTGILAGAGNRDPSKQGMASGAEIKIISYTSGFQDETLPMHLNENVTLTNSSYSDGCNVGYTFNALTVDEQIYENPTLMHVFSAGNQGQEDCGYGAGPVWGTITGGHKMAKNSIATANLRQDGTLDETSSRGPAFDGRLKPDISANGNGHTSTSPNHTYITFGGTSGAAPGIVGCLAQLTQGWKESHNGENPPTALLKAAILNTATDLGNAGPDFEFGYGQVNAWRAWNLLDQNRFYTYQVDQGQPGTTVVVNVPTGTRQARIMLLWPDPPALPSAARDLVNDLDLVVSDVNNATQYRPLVLDPTPTSAAITAVAIPRRDSLNNMEQVVLNNPQPGAYLATVTPFAVPEGPQTFWVVWEFLNDSVMITYPAGGEGLAPGEVERIRWDAFGTSDGSNFTLEFFNGQSWSVLATPNFWNQFYDWTVPNIVTANARLRLTRNGISHTTEPFSIVRVPSNITVAKVCPDSMTLSWNPLQDTLSYEVYLLGDRYMDPIGTTDASSFTFPISYPLQEKWVAVSAINDNGLAGRRSNAVRWPGELENCTQNKDLGVRVLMDPDPNGIYACEPIQQSFSVMVRNEGLEAISGATLYLKINNGAPTGEALPDLAPGAALTHTFQNGYSINNNDSLRLAIWADFPDDDFNWNDTLRITIPVLVQPATNYFTENFSNNVFPKPGWSVQNPDGSITWQRSASVTGINGNSTRAAWIDCFNYASIGQQDALQLIPVDLTNLANPSLVFDLAHARLTNHVEKLRVEVFPACDPEAQPVVIWEKADPALATTNPITGAFFPNEAADWRSEVASLADFAGQKVLIRIVATNDYGNNIFLDNVGIQSVNLNAPLAAFALPDTICRGTTLTYSAQSAGNLAEYNWSFGSGAIPVLAFGQGPHDVIYPTPGIKQVRLVVSNPLGSDTSVQLLTVLGFPAANFGASVDGLNVSFNNLSQNAASYLWDFGDGATSTEASPTHTYAGGGAYNVKMQAINECKTVTDSMLIALTVGVADWPAPALLQVSPNPTAGDFSLDVDLPRAETLQLDLFDALGRRVYSRQVVQNAGRQRHQLEGLNLPKGRYSLRVAGRFGVRSVPVTVQ
ncbi:MAG: S8 family serine peptidase [Saprospiraceae bacterium]|nr:S8 family serine peptidase [Saprospiraceae bacterium]